MARDARSSVSLDVNVGRTPDVPQPLDEETPFRIAILGDFRGVGGGGPAAAVPLERRRSVPVDRDNLDQVVAAWRPAVRLSLPDGTPSMLEFAAVDDFHADRLYQRLPVFARLRELRQELADGGAVARPASPPVSAPSPDVLANPASLLDQIVGEAPAEGEDLHAFIQRIVAPHVVRDIAPERAALIGQVDALSAMLLRFVLHHPEFQALESLWRSVFLMVRRVESSVTLQVHLLDVSGAELEADLAGARSPVDTGLYRLLSGSSGGPGEGAPWGLLVGAYTFGARADDIPLLGRIAAVAHAVGAPWVSAAHPRLVGCPDVSQLTSPGEWHRGAAADWPTLRSAADARWLGLVLPRFLVRLPYGAGAEVCETLAFEELTDPVNHEELLWGNAAVVCALLLAQSFEAAGWGLMPGMHRDLDGLPLHVRRRHGEATTTPCAEVLLTEASIELLLEAGVMPLACPRDGDSVRLVRFQSIAAPLAPLAGHWGGGVP